MGRFIAEFILECLLRALLFLVGLLVYWLVATPGILLAARSSGEPFWRHAQASYGDIADRWIRWTSSFV